MKMNKEVAGTLDLACERFKVALSQSENFEESIKKKWLLMSMQSSQKKMKKYGQKDR